MFARDMQTPDTVNTWLDVSIINTADAASKIKSQLILKIAQLTN